METNFVSMICRNIWNIAWGSQIYIFRKNRGYISE